MHTLTLAGFRRVEIPKSLAYWYCASTLPDFTPEGLIGLRSLQRCTHRGVQLQGLSYPAICPGCPVTVPSAQISPALRPPFGKPQQPTCAVCVRPSRAAHSRDLHPFDVGRVRRVTTRPFPCRPISLRRTAAADGVERRHRSPPALLACRASSITSTRLQQSPGWRPGWCDGMCAGVATPHITNGVCGMASPFT